MKDDNKIIKSNLKSLVKKFAKADVVSNIEKNYAKENIRIVYNDLIIDNSFVSSVKYDEKDFFNTIESIKENGVFTPFIVRKKNDKLEIITGRKRFLASKSVGKLEVPVQILNLSDEESLLMLLANIRDHRIVNNYEIALICDTLNKQYHYKKTDLAIILKQSLSQISNLIKLLSLPTMILEEISKGHFSYGHAKTISRLSEKDAKRVYKIIVDRHLSVRDSEKFVRDYINSGVLKVVKTDYVAKNNVITIKFSNSKNFIEADKKIQKLIQKNKIVL